MTSSDFEKLRETPISSLHLIVQEYRHTRTGARHFHLATDDTNNAFLVALRTVPQDSTGVAHILEHTTLCGSRHFPVRDPFFMMIRRSLNTFMNAFTSSDWTAYPFASQNRKDFDNLLQVYLDAVFFPRLDQLDFAQEGHRVEFAVPGDPDGELLRKGVVYNEMKGAMSAPVRRVWQTLQSTVFPTTTYHYNSGGEPRDIPRLSYEELLSFHRDHYHPSNAVFMTYGDLPVTEHQVRIEELALREFDRRELGLEIPRERRYPAPVTATGCYPLDPAQNEAEKTHIVMGWLLGESANLRASMHAQLLSDTLLDNSASPLRRALETTNLGTAPSELAGLDDDFKEMIFVCGLEGSEPGRAEAVERLVLDVLEDVSEHGVPHAQVEAVLHQLELSQREIGGGRFPYGLQLMVKALPAVLHGADPVQVLDIDPVLEELREDIQDPAFVPSLVRQTFLDNTHRVRLTMAPDKGLNAREEAEERAEMTSMKAGMSEQARLRIVELAVELKTRQEHQDDPSVLPKVGLEDVPDTLRIPEEAVVPVGPFPATWYEQPTNGLVYEQIVVDMPSLDPALVDRLPLFSECLTEVGCGNRDYLETQSWQASVSGGISARASVRGDVTDVSRVKGIFAVGSKALTRNQASMAELLKETFTRARFDELPRLRELIAQIRAYREAHVTSHGHVLAMTTASQGIGPAGALAHRWSGLESIRFIKKLDDILDKTGELERLAEALQVIQSAILSSPPQLLVVSEGKARDLIREGIEAHWSAGLPVAGHAAFSPSIPATRVRQAWGTSTQVNFCAKAYQTTAQDHRDAAALMVLGPFLRNGFLHRAIREQGGAYGAGAGYNSDTGAFRFFSYRDPRLVETLTDFDRSVDWLLNEPHEYRELEEAILNVISEIDRPESPAGEAISAFFGSIHGRTPEHRRRFRHRILEVRVDDLRRVGEHYLSPEAASIAVISDPKTLEQHSDLGLELHHL